MVDGRLAVVVDSDAMTIGHVAAVMVHVDLPGFVWRCAHVRRFHVGAGADGDVLVVWVVLKEMTSIDSRGRAVYDGLKVIEELTNDVGLSHGDLSG